MDNKHNILKQSLNLFAEKGFHAVGVQEIVNKSKISKPTLYHYFGSKEGLFHQLLESEFRDILHFLKGEAHSEKDISQKLESIVRYFLVFTMNNRDFSHIYLSISFSPSESAESSMGGPYLKKISHFIEEMFIDASYSHGNMRGRHQNYSASFLGMINTYISLLLKGEIENSDTLIYSIVHQFSHGIYS